MLKLAKETGLRPRREHGHPRSVVTNYGGRGRFLAGLCVWRSRNYIPLLALCLIAHLLSKRWGRVALAAALGITIYWPVVCLAAIVAARNAEGWSLPRESEYWIVLPLIALWAAWGLWHLSRQPASSLTSDCP